MKPITELAIGVASDHAGYDLKLKVTEYLNQKGVCRVVDFGCESSESCDYADYAHPLALAVEAHRVDFGIAICGSGNGITMTLNKHQHIRAALCWLPELGALARQHNNANVLSLPARYLTTEEVFAIVDAFFSSDFEGGRHQARVDKIALR